MIRTIFLLVALLCCPNLEAQDTIILENRDADLMRLNYPTKPFGIATGVAYVNEMGGFMSSVNIDYFFYQKVSVGITYGIFLKDIRNNIYCFELKYWHRKQKQSGFSPFIGFSLISLETNTHDYVLDGDIIWEKEYFYLLEAPIGIIYTTKSGLQTSLQLSYHFVGFSPEQFFGPNIELRVGWRFNFRKGRNGLQQ